MKNSKSFSYTVDPSIFLPAEHLALCQRLFYGHNKICLTLVDLESLHKSQEQMNSDSFALDFLRKTEQKKYLSFSYDKRKLEWLGGRIAAKISTSSLIFGHESPIDWQAFEVAPNSTGRPYIIAQVPTSFSPDISISHSNHLACGLASQHLPCGIDLQKITTTTVKVKERFASPKEQLLLQQSCLNYDATTALTLLWTAKEAFRKAYACNPLLGFTDLEMIEIVSIGDSAYRAKFTCKSLQHVTDSPMHCFLSLHDDYAFSLTFAPKVQG